MIASYLKHHKPRSKILALDAKDAFSKQGLFQDAWAELYPGLVEWVSLSQGGKVVEVDAAARRLVTEFGDHVADVVNVIPPQRAAPIALQAGVADRSGWCPVDPVTFESRLQPDVHVIGDAAIMGGMPKSAFAANAQAKVCAIAIADLFAGRAPATPRLVNTCYSLVGPEYGISIAAVYRLGEDGGAEPDLRRARLAWWLRSLVVIPEHADGAVAPALRAEDEPGNFVGIGHRPEDAAGMVVSRTLVPHGGQKTGLFGGHIAGQTTRDQGFRRGTRLFVISRSPVRVRNLAPCFCQRERGIRGVRRAKSHSAAFTWNTCSDTPSGRNATKLADPTQV
jgi:hypothetical protein